MQSGMQRTKPRYNAYRVANKAGSDEHPVDDDLERRLRHTSLTSRIRRSQDAVVAALGEGRSLYFALEQLLSERTEDREETMFNLGYEHGLLQGGTDAMAALWRKSARARRFARQLGRLAMAPGLKKAQTVAVLLEVAWSLSLQPRRSARSGLRHDE
jgi:hypothetical protein